MDLLSQTDFRPLHSEAADLLRRASAPPRLMAHLVLVHDVASRLIDELTKTFPDLQVNRDAVLFGAATHDFGKVLCVSELQYPGKEHEQKGVELLLAMGIPEDRARFAYTHGNWDSVPGVRLEDLLVALADNCWKGKRIDPLESKIVDLLHTASGKERWYCYAVLDEIVVSLAADADARLEWQRQFGIHPTSIEK